MMSQPTRSCRRNAPRALVFYIGIVVAVALSSSAIASDELVSLSEFFAMKRVSGGIGSYKWEGNEIYLRVPGKKPQYIGFIDGGPPTGMGPLSRATKERRAVAIAVSKDGRSLVFRQSTRNAGSGSRLESGIYQYVYGTGVRVIRLANELSGLSYTQYEKALPPDILPFKYKLSYTPKDLQWAIKATGEEFPLALLDASPLHWAAFDGRTDECTKLIKGGTDADARTYWDFTALDLAIIRNHQETAIHLLALDADPDAGLYPAFHRAVMLGRMMVVQAMLDRGTDINGTDSHGYTPLHLAVFAGSRLVGGVSTFFDNAETPRSILDKNVTTPLVQLLLDKGADPASRDKYGKTPLDAASGITPPEVWELLNSRSRAH